MPALLDQLRRMAPTVSVGMLTADLMNLGPQLSAVSEAGVQLIHVDVMDGCFCPALTVGPPLVKAMNASPMLLDVHLMVRDPLALAESFVAAGADMLTFHVESTIHPRQVLQALGKMTNARDPGRGIVRGVALNPGTPLQVLEPLLDDLEMVLLLAVNPGWGGQKFSPQTPQRLKIVREMIRATGRQILLAVDGGVTRENIAAIAAMNADLIITGSAVFDGKAPADNARFMLQALGAHANKEFLR